MTRSRAGSIWIRQRPSALLAIEEVLGERGSRAIEGPLFGTQLEAVPSRTTFWYAFAAAFPDAELYR